MAQVVRASDIWLWCWNNKHMIMCLKHTETKYTISSKAYVYIYMYAYMDIYAFGFACVGKMRRSSSIWKKNSNWTSCNYYPIPFWSATHYHWPRKSLDVIWVVLGFQHHLPGSFASQSLISALKNPALVLNSWKIHHEFINLKFATNKKKAENDTLHLKIGHEEIQKKNNVQSVSPVAPTLGIFDKIWGQQKIHRGFTYNL